MKPPLALLIVLAAAACGDMSNTRSGKSRDATTAQPDGGSIPATADGGASDVAAADGVPGDGTGVDEDAVRLPDGPPPPPKSCDPVAATKVIGNWNLVPKQLFDGTFEVGVVAFHEQGVDVEISVNGTKLATVEHPSYNPRTKTFEYWVALEASSYADGPITLSATILPDCPAHTERQLEDVELYANAGGTLTNSAVRWADCNSGDDATGDGSKAKPYATIEKAFVEVGEGGSVYLAAGACYKTTKLYPAKSYTRWTTVQPGPGVTRSEVKILTNGAGAEGRFGENMVRWKDVQLYKDVAPGYSTLFYFEKGHWVWFDGAELYDANGRFSGGFLVGGNSPYRVFSTGALIRDVMNMNNVCGFCRHVTAKNIGSDIFRARSNTMSIGMTVDTVDKGSTAAHPDFFQFYTTGGAIIDNIVIYNTRVVNMGAQGIFGGGCDGQLRNAAFVNLEIERTSSTGYLSQLTGTWEHVLLWHVTLVNGPFWLRATGGLKDFYVQNNVWQMFHAGGTTSLPAMTIEHNLVRELNWNQPQPMGTDAQVADPLFVDEATDDFHLQNGSPAAGAGVPLPGVPVDIDNKYYDPIAPNLGAHAG